MDSNAIIIILVVRYYLFFYDAQRTSKYVHWRPCCAKQQRRHDACEETKIIKKIDADNDDAE